MTPAMALDEVPVAAIVREQRLGRPPRKLRLGRPPERGLVWLVLGRAAEQILLVLLMRREGWVAQPYFAPPAIRAGLS